MKTLNDPEAVTFAQLTQTLSTMGLDDVTVSPKTTLRLGEGHLSLTQTPREFVRQLPQLMDDKSTQTLPEVRVKGTLGKGGMGLVQLAEQMSLGRDVAVKQVRQDSRSDASTLVLLREGWTTGLLEHPNIVPVHAMGRDSHGEPAIVMKKISGTAWSEIIADPDQAPPTFDFSDPFELHVDILSQVCNAIDYAHSQGVIHRDLKPENVMIGEFGEVYVLDWGIAISLREDPTGRLAHVADEEMPVGTPAYMAPEMVDGDGDLLGIHTDVFLLGAVLYEALTGELPYQGKTLFQMMFKAHLCKPPEFGDEVPPELAAICKKAMARNPEERFASAGELREALQHYRRNREARRLAEQGEERLEELRELAAAERQGDDIDERALYKVFSESRFAFEQSREIVADGPRATEGLQQALEVMANRELAQEAHKAASLLIADLPTRNRDLEARAEALGEELAARRQDFATLRQISYDVDATVGRRSRIIFALIFGIFWAGASGIVTWLVESGRLALSHPRTFAHIIGLTLTIGAILFIWRKRFFANEHNKKMLVAAVISFAVVTVHRGMAWIQDLPFHVAVAHEMLMYGLAVMVVGFCLEKKLMWAGLPFVGFALLGAYQQAWMLWLFVPANLLGMALAIWAWWPRGDDDALSPLSSHG